MANVIAIDIGSSFIKLTEVEVRPKIRLLNAIIFKNPNDAKSIQKEINKHISPKKLNTYIVGVTLPNTAVSTISMFLPKMNKAELTSAAITEAKRRLIPVSSPDHIFEYSVIGEKTVSKIHKLEVLAVRTEKSHIQALLNLFQESGITPSFITPSCCCLPGLIPKNLRSEDKDVLFVDIGTSSLGIHICREGHLAVTRNIAYGLNDIIRDLSRQFNISDEEAETAVREYGVSQTILDIKDKVAVAEEIMRQKYEAGNADDKNKINFLELRMFWQAHIERIINELRRSFIYYKEQSGGRSIEGIYFLGGGSQIKNLVDILSGSIGGQCKIISSLFEDMNSTPIFANALSLALDIASSEYRHKLINFIPPELKKEKTAGLRRFGLFAACICLMAVFGIASLNMFINSRLLEASFKETEFELNRLKKTADKLKILDQQESRVKNLSSKIEMILKQKLDFSLILEELKRLTPERALFVQVSISKGGKGDNLASETKTMPEYGQALSSPGKVNSDGRYIVEIKGEVSADYEDAVKIIGEFRKLLASSRYFSSIEIVPLELEQISVREENMNGELRLTREKIRDFTITFEISAK